MGWEEWKLIGAGHCTGSFLNLLARHPSWSLPRDCTESLRVLLSAAEEQLPCSASATVTFKGYNLRSQ